jgi:hypothetical protein
MEGVRSREHAHARVARERPCELARARDGLARGLGEALLSRASRCRVERPQESDPDPRASGRPNDERVEIISARLSRGIVVKVVELAHGRDPRAEHLSETEERGGLERLVVEREHERVERAGHPVLEVTRVVSPPTQEHLEAVGVCRHEAREQRRSMLRDSSPRGRKGGLGPDRDDRAALVDEDSLSFAERALAIGPRRTPEGGHASASSASRT